ncbi:hypothetical protein A2635_02515 [Candidatus Peribacteria bacterium RIFCSPHIGHO2_01_FULL_51_9]|nr:MAG: hypothetical protein A2635_02515 [Candidatus Peribacteria bacterium RIFCSPHIGHO2_01_FULL_51_9]
MVEGNIEIILFLVCLSIFPDTDSAMGAIVENAAARVTAIDVDESGVGSCLIGPECPEGIRDRKEACLP